MGCGSREALSKGIFFMVAGENEAGTVKATGFVQLITVQRAGPNPGEAT